MWSCFEALRWRINTLELMWKKNESLSVITYIDYAVRNYDDVNHTDREVAYAFKLEPNLHIQRELKT